MNRKAIEQDLNAAAGEVIASVQRIAAGFRHVDGLTPARLELTLLIHAAVMIAVQRNGRSILQSLARKLAEE